MVGTSLARLRPSLRPGPWPLPVIASAAKQSISPHVLKHGLLRCARNDGDIVSRSRDMFCPSFASSFAPSNYEGAGKTGCVPHPRSRVRYAQQELCTRAYRFGGSIPAFPAQWLYGLYRALPGENGSFASVARVRLSPFPDLTPAVAASEPHDFTVRLRRAPSLAPSASIASHRAFVTIASAPQSCGGDGRSYGANFG
jgi:hypothetical protein